MLPLEGSLQSFRSGLAHVQVYGTITELGAAAANKAAEIITDSIEQGSRARVIVATGNSQVPLIESLVTLPIEWSAVEVFHMDEYVGMSSDHRSSFRYWIRTRVEDRVHPLKTHYLEGDAADLDAELKRYAQLLISAPVDLAFVGF
jgi:glucosamine-6-phosphate deaminase